MSNISFFVEKRKKLINEFKHGKDSDIEKRIDFVSKILEENNTEEEFLIEYLELKLKNQNGNKECTDESFRKDLETYEVGINKEDFNKKFGNYFLKKSAYEKLIDLFEKLRGIIYEKSKEDKLLKIIEILEMKNKKYKQTFPISYSINKELYFNSLIYMVIKQIKKRFSDENKKLGKLDKKKVNDKIDEYEKKKDEIKNFGNLTEEEKYKKIVGFNKIINYISLCLFNKFFEYFKLLGIFIDEIFLNFKKKFENNTIFKTKKFEIAQKNDIYLFSDFIFFLMKYNFKDDDMAIFASIWKETFSPILKEKKDYISQDLILKYINNDLMVILQNKDGTKEHKDTIKNIDYYTDEFVNVIKTYKGNIDCFKKINYLKMDKYNSSIFIKFKWNELSNYIVDILLSPTIQQIYSIIYDSKKHVELKRDDIKQVLDDLHFFNYSTDFVAETKKRFLFIYFQASISSEKKLDINIKKIIYLVIFLISCFHEIIGHLYLRINCYLYKKENISSPIPQNPSSYGIGRQKESGEFIEERLFGDYEYKMTIKQILFTLDKNNYKNDLSDFRKNFKKADERDIENISKDLVNILNMYEISLDDLNYDSTDSYQVNKSRRQQKYTFPDHHSILQIDSDDD